MRKMPSTAIKLSITEILGTVKEVFAILWWNFLKLALAGISCLSDHLPLSCGIYVHSRGI